MPEEESKRPFIFKKDENEQGYTIHNSESMEEKPTIDIDSPAANRKHTSIPRLLNLTMKERIHVCSILEKFRKRQIELLESESITDPDPFEPTYIFYCFKGMSNQLDNGDSVLRCESPSKS